MRATSPDKPNKISGFEVMFGGILGRGRACDGRSDRSLRLKKTHEEDHSLRR